MKLIMSNKWIFPAVILAAFVMLPKSIFATTPPTEVWTQPFSSPCPSACGAINFPDIAVDSAGNSYVVNYAALYGPLSDSNQLNVLKYDPSGNLLWSEEYDSGIGFGYINPAIAVDSSGNSYITGLSSGNGATTYVIKYDTNGNLLWSSLISNDGFASNIAADPSGNSYTVASNITKYNSAGTVQWSISTAQGSNGYTLPNVQFTDSPAIAVDPSGNSYVIVAGNDDIGDPDGPSGPYYPVVIKHNSSGTLVWESSNTSATQIDPLNPYQEANYIGGTAGPYNEAGIAVDHSSGSVYVLAKYQNSGSVKLVLIKFDGSGNFVWSKIEGNAYSSATNSITLDSSGNIYITDNYSISEYDSQGNLIWTTPFQSSVAMLGIGVNPSGTQIDITGQPNEGYTGSADFVTSQYAVSNTSSSVTIGDDRPNNDLLPTAWRIVANGAPTLTGSGSGQTYANVSSPNQYTVYDANNGNTGLYGFAPQSTSTGMKNPSSIFARVIKSAEAGTCAGWSCGLSSGGTVTFNATSTFCPITVNTTLNGSSTTALTNLGYSVLGFSNYLNQNTAQTIVANTPDSSNIIGPVADASGTLYTIAANPLVSSNGGLYDLTSVTPALSQTCSPNNGITYTLGYVGRAKLQVH